MDGLNGIDRHGNRETSRHRIHILRPIHEQHTLAFRLPVEINLPLRLYDARAYGKRLGEFTGAKGQGLELLLADRRGRADALGRNLGRFTFDFDGFLVSTWLPTETRHSRTRARNGARSTVSIFMLSSTRIGASASTSSPTATGVATTSAGRGRADDAALVAADPVGDAVHLDQVDRAVGGGGAAGTAGR